MTWRPLLARAVAEDVIRDIAEHADQAPALDASLARGSAGVALLYGALEPESARCERHIDRALTAIAQRPSAPTLHLGFVGAPWVATHLGWLDDDELERSIAASLATAPERAQCELMLGLAGLVVYLRERLPAPLAVRTLAGLVAAMRRSATPDADGPTWIAADGRPHLGVAHGIAGIAAAVAHAAVAAGDADGVTLARAAARAVLARLPAREQLNDQIVFGWCHADVGIAAALFGAARAMGDDELAGGALAVGRAALGRHRDDDKVRDASFCHGAAGLGHLFNRLHQGSGEADFADAARFWYARALALRGAQGAGAGGYSAWLVRPDGTMGWCDEVGLLHGSAGVALALHAAISDAEPTWDRVFALS